MLGWPGGRQPRQEGGHNRGPAPDRGCPPARGGFGLRRCDSAGPCEGQGRSAADAGGAPDASCTAPACVHVTNLLLQDDLDGEQREERWGGEPCQPVHHTRPRRTHRGLPSTTCAAKVMATRAMARRTWAVPI